MKKYAFLFAAVALAFVSCREKNKVDVIPPVISEVTIDGDDSTAVTVTAGENLTIRVVMTDNMGLNEVQFNIHPAQDGHVHTTSGHPGGEERLNSGAWFAEGVADVSGTSSNYEFDVSVPDDIAGNWHLAVNLMDDVGESAIERVVLIKVVNEEMPEITVTTIPAIGADGNIIMTEGTNLTVSGQASDNGGLEFLRAFVVNQLWESEDTTDIDILGNATTQAFSNLTFDNFPEGEFRLILEAGDSLGLVRKWDAIIFVNE
jgi:hypothetical protein